MVKFDLYNVLFNTSLKISYLKKLKKLVNDDDKHVRLSKHLCQICYYSDKVGGAALTHAICACCNKEMLFSSTYTDILCEECAKNHRVCKHCISDINFKNRRKL
jgi:hypothetical protein